MHGSGFLAKPCRVFSSGLGRHHAGEWRQQPGDGWDHGSPHGHILTARRLRALLRVGPVWQDSLLHAAGQEL